MSKTPRQTVQHVLSWGVHLFTTSGAVLGLFAIHSVYKHDLKTAFILIFASIIVDSFDGTLARLCDVKKHTPSFDGALLDNIVDYLTYVIFPAVVLLTTSLLPPSWAAPLASAVVLSSGYQFAQADAKTADHFFKGFPSYWNIVVFYLAIWNLSPSTNAFIIGILVLLVFVPIKFLYPSRLEFASSKKYIIHIITIATYIWGIATGFLLMIFPTNNWIASYTVIGYIVGYTAFSIYRTLRPLKK